MLKIKKITPLIYLLLLLFLNSCITVMVEDGYEKKEHFRNVIKDEYIVYSFDSYDFTEPLTHVDSNFLKTTYLFENNMLSVKFDNISAIPLYINLSLSEFSINGDRTRYLNLTKDVSINKIPPNSYYIISNIDSKLYIDSLKHMGNSLYDKLINDSEKKLNFVESNSPVYYKNKIYLSPSKEFDSLSYIENSFWVNNIELVRDEFSVKKNNCKTETHNYYGKEMYFKNEPIYRKKHKVSGMAKNLTLLAVLVTAFGFALYMGIR